MIRCERFTFQDNVLKAYARKIRTEVFVVEQKVPEDLEYDTFDENAQHYLLFLGEEPIATARWRETSKGIKLERFAMLASYRNRGFGSILLEEVMKDVEVLGKPIYLNAQERAVKYYERFGFIKEGAPFMEAGIRHFRMFWP